MEDAVNQGSQAMGLRTAFKKYSICMAAFIAVLTIAIWASSETLGWLAFFVYCGCGIYLNRTVLRSIVEWHSMYNTILNVSRAKLNQAAWWPISYLTLFIRLGINKVL